MKSKKRKGSFLSITKLNSLAYLPPSVGLRACVCVTCFALLLFAGYNSNTLFQDGVRGAFLPIFAGWLGTSCPATTTCTNLPKLLRYCPFPSRSRVVVRWWDGWGLGPHYHAAAQTGHAFLTSRPFAPLAFLALHPWQLPGQTLSPTKSYQIRPNPEQDAQGYPC